MTEKQKNILKIIITAAILVLIGAGLRLLPHPPNFTPIAAIALFAGAYLTKRVAFLLPLAALVISDVFIGYYSLPLMIAVYGSFALTVVLGFWLKKNKKWSTVLGSSIVAALIFFFVTNFAVWALSPWYAKSLSGLIQCFVLAIPFFKNTLLGNLFYVPVIFGSYELSRLLIRKRFALPKAIFNN